MSGRWADLEKRTMSRRRVDRVMREVKKAARKMFPHGPIRRGEFVLRLFGTPRIFQVRGPRLAAGARGGRRREGWILTFPSGVRKIAARPEVAWDTAANLKDDKQWVRFRTVRDARAGKATLRFINSFGGRS